MSPLPAIGIGAGAVSLVMLGLWLIQRRTHNAGTVDIAWSFGVGLLGVWFAFTGSGPLARRVLIGVLIGVWGLRLGSHLLRRVLSESEDPRYAALRKQWGKRTQLYLFLFFQLQAIWAVLFALPILVAAHADRAALDVRDFVGLAIAVIAIAGESLADRQLARFRAEGPPGRVCRRGLWRYSRHPNYFFEWVHWWAYVAIGVGLGWGLVTLGGPILMLLFLCFVTGIPPTEARLLESRGDAYRQYQKETSAFFPWPPRTTEETT